MNESSVSEVWGIVRFRETVPRQCCKEGTETAGQISSAPRYVCKCFIVGAETGKIRRSVLYQLSIGT